MLKKNYRYLLTFLAIYGCKKSPDQEYNEALERNYSEKKNFYIERLSITELQTVAVQGLYNYLLQYNKDCQICKKLRIDPDIAQKILEGYLFFYQICGKTDLGMVNPDQKKILNERLSDAILVLQQSKFGSQKKKDEASFVVSCACAVLGGTLDNNSSDDLTRKKLDDSVNRYFIEQYGEIENFYLTENSEDAARKITSIIEIFRNKDIICGNVKNDTGLDNNTFKDNLKNYLRQKLISTAFKIVVENGCVLKESDKANDQHIHPTYLMKLLSCLLPYNTETGIEKYKSFKIKDNNLKEFVFQIIWTLLLSTSDALNAEFQPNPLLYLRFDSVDIPEAFQIRALLIYFFSECYDFSTSPATVNPVFKPEISHLSCVFRNADYYHIPDSSKKTPAEIIKVMQTIRNSENEELRRQYFTGKTLNQFKDGKWATFLDSIFIEQVCLNLKKEAEFAFGVDGDANDGAGKKKDNFIFNNSFWIVSIRDVNVKQNIIPASFIYSMKVCVTGTDEFNKGITIYYNDDEKKNYFKSLSNPKTKSLLKEIIYFTNNMLKNGISIEDCTNFKSFVKKVLEKYPVKLTPANLVDILNYDLESNGVQIPDFGTAGYDITPQKDNIEKIILLILQNRNGDMMDFAEVFLERILNVCLLKLLIDYIFPTVKISAP